MNFFLFVILFILLYSCTWRRYARREIRALKIVIQAEYTFNIEFATIKSIVFAACLYALGFILKIIFMNYIEQQQPKKAPANLFPFLLFRFSMHFNIHFLRCSWLLFQLDASKGKYVCFASPFLFI